MKFQTPVILILLLAAVNVSAATELSLRLRHLSREDGLSQAQVYSIAQDRNGYLWFGTQGGLNRFDGHEIRVFRSNPLETSSLPHNTVRDILRDSRDEFWIATDRGLTRLAEDQESFHQVPLGNGASQPLVRVLHEDAQGRLWAGTDGAGLHLISTGPVNDQLPPGVRNSSVAPVTSESKIPAVLSLARIWALTSDNSGFLWIGTETGLYRLHPESGQLFHYQPGLEEGLPSGSDHVRALLVDDESRLWVGTENGLYRQRQDGSFLRYFLAPAENSAGHQISSITEDSAGRIWVGTFDGLFLQQPGQPEAEAFRAYQHVKDDPYSLAHNTVLSVFEDEGKVIWIGTYEGVDRWNSRSQPMKHFSTVNTGGALRSDTIASFTEGRDGRIWVGTFGGGLHLFDMDALDFIDYFPGLPELDRVFLEKERVMSLMVDRGGNLWIGTRRSGLARLSVTGRGYQLTRFMHDPEDPGSLSSDAVSAILEDSRGILWVATFGGGVNRLDRQSGRVIRYLASEVQPDPATAVASDVAENLSSNDILAIFEDSRGTLWVGTQNGGLNRYDRTRDVFEPVPIQKGNRIFSVSSFAEDDGGVLWLGTLEYGLLRWQDPGLVENALIRYVDRTDGLPADEIYAIQVVNDTVWVSTSHGLAGMSGDVVRSLDISDGLQGLEFNHGASLLTTGGYLLFGGLNGFNLFDPDRIQSDRHGPPTRISGVQVGDRNIGLHQAAEIEMTHRDYLLSLEFVGLDYVSPEQIHYRYRLEGLDEDWINVGGRGEARFTNLRPGRYQFFVQSANNKQVWGPVAGPIDVVVKPAPWATWWAYLLYLGLLALVLWLVFRGQARRIRLADQVIATNRALEEEVYLREAKEQQLRLERDRVRGYLDASKLIHIELDDAGAVRFIDAHGLNVLGLTWADTIGRKLTDLVSARTAASFSRFLERAGQSDDEFVLENGQHLSRRILWRSRRVVDPDSSQDRTLLVGLDVTEQRQLEQVLRQREKMTAMGELAGGLAHDFNNILTAIYGYGVLVTQQVKDDPRLTDYMGKIVQATERARSLVERLLTFARSEESALEPADVRSAIQEAAELLRGSLPASIELVLEMPERELGARIDTTQIHQLIMNLGTNADKAMRSSQGTLTIRVESCDLSADEIPPDSMLSAGPHVRIQVSDTGIGIAPENLGQIFNPFFTTSGEGFGGNIQGTGLGLAVVHSIITAHDGHISVSSRRNAGTTFTMLLPACDLEASEPVPDGKSYLATGDEVVLVDDDKMVGEVGEVILQSLGYRVVLFDNPFQALDYLLSGDPEKQQILVTDEIMPGLTGSELLKKVRASRPDIPVVLTSGNLRPFSREDGVFFVRKPYTFEVFQEVIERAVSYRSEQLQDLADGESGDRAH